MASFVPSKIKKRLRKSDSDQTIRSTENDNLHIRIVEGVGLHCNDLYLKNTNLYCKISSSSNPNESMKTNYVQKEMNTIFNATTSLKIDENDIANGALQIGIFDHGIAQDLGQEDNEIGVASLSLSHFKQNKVFQGWIPIRSPSDNEEKQQNDDNNNDPQTGKDASSKKKSSSFFATKKLKSLSDKVTSNETLNKAYQKTQKVASNVANQVAEHATTVATHLTNQASKLSQQQGKTQRDSARLYVIIALDDKNNLKITSHHSQQKSIKVFALTFNAGNCGFSHFNDSLAEWLPNDGSIDLYVLGFQELNETEQNVDDDQEAKRPMEDDQFQDNDQQTVLKEYFLQYLSQYKCISHRNMWQTRLFLFAKDEHSNIISNVVSDFVGAGFGGIAPNKGAVAVSFDFDGVSLCFLSCHLAAHQTKITERNAMYSKICKQIRVGLPKQSLFGQFHCVVVLGDLNYRIDVDGEQHSDKAKPEIYERARELIANNSLAELLQYDQLNSVRKSGDAFTEFNEAEIKFAPTFKMERKPGMKYLSQRIPAWCDRILWRCRNGYDVKANQYKMYDTVCISDHKPVSCVFTMNIWRRSCGISDEYKQAEIQLKNVNHFIEESADNNIKMEPYIYFAKQLLLHNNYDCDDAVSLLLRRNNVLFLQHSVLLYQIKDREQRAVMDIDVIGSGYIELKACVNKLNEWIPFKQPIHSSGIKKGTLTGFIKLVVTK